MEFAEPAYTIYSSTNLDFDTDLLRYGYTSMTTPNSTYDYNMKTRERKLLKQQEVVGGYNPDDYQTERLWATAKDGTKIPCPLFTKKELRKMAAIQRCCMVMDRMARAWILTFPSTRLSLLDRGFVYALRTSVVVQKWVVSGTRMVRCLKRKTPSPTLLTALSF
jgi:oligopeptidase B